MKQHLLLTTFFLSRLPLMTLMGTNKLYKNGNSGHCRQEKHTQKDWEVHVYLGDCGWRARRVQADIIGEADLE